MTTLCHATLPKKFLKIMDKYENDPIAMRDAGIAYAVSQIVDLIANDVDGIHLYTMNNPYIAEKICEAVKSAFLIYTNAKGAVKKRNKARGFPRYGKPTGFNISHSKKELSNLEKRVQQTQRHKNCVFAVLKMWKIF